MKSGKLYKNFVKKWEEVTEVTPQTVGPFTPLYKKTVPLVKVDPWRIIIPLTFIAVAGGVLLLDVTAPQIASLLQRGF